jgi:glutamine synthetase
MGLSKVTHYTHWFQHGATAENMMLSLKHMMVVIQLKFGGAQLIQQEPDASSFQMEN